MGCSRMINKLLIRLIFGGFWILVVGITGLEFNIQAAQSPTIQIPVLKWSHGGCYTSWCETGWYASPAVVDLDGNGSIEVLGGAYSLFVLNGQNGELLDRIDTPGSRIWPGIVVIDLNGDGHSEIISAQGGGYLMFLITI